MYQLNPAAARAANEGNKFITEAGKYVGTFTSAENVTSNKGTKGIEFTFSTGHQEADYLTIWTINKEGKELHGLKVLNAIMACMKVRSIAPKDGVIEKYSQEIGGKTKVNASVFPDLMGKPVGLVLQGEEYKNSKGEVKTKMTIFAPFEAATELTADEILDSKVQPHKLAKLVQYIMENPVRRLKASPQASASLYEPSAQSEGFSDDIPF